jgi:hypothetical protein
VADKVTASVIWALLDAKVVECLIFHPVCFISLGRRKWPADPRSTLRARSVRPLNGATSTLGSHCGAGEQRAKRPVILQVLRGLVLLIPLAMAGDSRASERTDNARMHTRTQTDNKNSSEHEGQELMCATRIEKETLKHSLYGTSCSEVARNNNNLRNAKIIMREDG